MVDTDFSCQCHPANRCRYVLLALYTIIEHPVKINVWPYCAIKSNWQYCTFNYE